MLHAASIVVTHTHTHAQGKERERGRGRESERAHCSWQEILGCYFAHTGFPHTLHSTQAKGHYGLAKLIIRTVVHKKYTYLRGLCLFLNV